MRKTKEIRELLMGRIQVRNGFVYVAHFDETHHIAGGNGVFNAMFLGVMQRKEYFQVPQIADVEQDVINALKRMGTFVKLQENPEVLATMRRSPLTDYCIFTADATEDGLLEMAAFKGRSFFGDINLFLSMKKLMSGFPEGYQKVKTKKTSRKEHRQEKQSRKQEIKPSRKKAKPKLRILQAEKAVLMQNLSLLKKTPPAGTAQEETEETQRDS